MRTSILFAASILLFGLGSLPAGAQDAFAGASPAEPELMGSTNGTVHSVTILSGQSLQKALDTQLKMSAALTNGSLTEFALAAYKLHAMSGLDEYKHLAELAMGEVDIDDVDNDEVLAEHLPELKRIFELQGKSDQYYLNVLVRFGQQPGKHCDELALTRNDVAVQSGLGTNPHQLAIAGLRKFSGNELRVHIQGVSGLHDIMVRKCIKNSLEQIAAATHGGLAVKFVGSDKAPNMEIGFDDRESLWYAYQHHSTATITEPLEGPRIDYIRLKVPMKATMHRAISEAECQDYCNREISRALGFAWHPVSRERFANEFADYAKAAHRRRQADGKVADRDLAQGSGELHLRACVQKALDGAAEAEGGFAYYGGLAYLDKGDFAMARRYFCNATEYFIAKPQELHRIVSRFLGAGDVTGAELIAFACINDDPDNDENSQATREYNRARKHPLSTAPAAHLSNTEVAMLARLYPPSVATSHPISKR